MRIVLIEVDVTGQPQIEEYLVDTFSGTGKVWVRSDTYTPELISAPVETEATFDLEDLRDFLVEHQGATEHQAQGFATRAMEGLLSNLGDREKLLAYCQLCGGRRAIDNSSGNLCRCRPQGWPHPAAARKWSYLNRPSMWEINKQSLLLLTDRDLRLLSKPAQARVRLFMEYLRRG